MASTQDNAGDSLLKNRSIKPGFDLSRSMIWVRQAQGVSVPRQLWQIQRLARGPGRLQPDDYYAFALFRPALRDAERRAFLSARASRALNLRLSPVRLPGLHGLMTDKLLSSLVLLQAGLPAIAPLALFSAAGERPGLRSLRTPEDLARWLLTEAPLPVFGKPLDGSLSVGAAGILAAEGADLILGDGRRVAAGALAGEIARDYGNGWLVQPLLRLHPEVAAIAGTAVAMLRIVTLRDREGPQALYGVLRLPAPGAMIDTNTGRAPNGSVVVDLATGAFGRAQSNWRMNTTPLETSTATGVALAGRVLPFVPEARAVCEAAHRLFPQQGILGFDIALTAEGPVIVEVNSMPHHNNWQRAADRGLMNPDFAPRIAAAIAETGRRIAREEAELARIDGQPLRPPRRWRAG